MYYAIIAIVWTCVALFVITAAITLLALLNVVTLGGNQSAHQDYLKTLFRTLIVEIIVISVGAFAAAVKNNSVNNDALAGTVATTLEGHETRIRLLEKGLLQK
jgi:hypothetical protein